MKKQSITFNRYTIADVDKIAVYSKLRARHAATGLEYFAKLRTSTTLAINGIADGIGEDMLHAATLGRLEAEAYIRDVAHNMPLSLAAFDVLLEDFGNYQKLEQHCQYSEVQAVIDNELTSGGTGRNSTTKAQTEKVKKIKAEAVIRWEAAEAAAKAAEAHAAAKAHHAAAEAAVKAAEAAAKAAEAAAKAAKTPIAVTAAMIKDSNALDKALFAILKKWSLVSVCQLYSAGTSWEDIADILGYSNAAAAKMAFQRAKAKLVKAGITAFLK